MSVETYAESRFERAVEAIKQSQREAEKEATRLELTHPELSIEARARADGLADARRLVESLSTLQAAMAALQA